MKKAHIFVAFHHFKGGWEDDWIEDKDKDKDKDKRQWQWQAHIFVAFHHFSGGWEDDWSRIKVADVAAVGSHLFPIDYIRSVFYVIISNQCFHLMIYNQI